MDRSFIEYRSSRRPVCGQQQAGCQKGLARGYMSDLKKDSASTMVSGFWVYSVGTVPSLKHSKRVF
jgi:hypothetical protein